MDRRRKDWRSHDDHRGAEKRLVLGAGVLGAAAVAAVALVFAGAGRAVGPVCKTSGPVAGTYTATVCVSTPGSGSTISGATPVTATVAFSGTTPPGVQRVTFYLDGLYLITDYSAPYTFTLPSERHIDGSHVLEAEALLRSAFTTSRVATPLTFANGVTTPPVNTRTFTPKIGTPAAGKPLVVAAAGDGAGGGQSEADVVGLIKSWNPNLFLYLGDVYEDGSPTEFANWYGAPGFYGDLRPVTNPTIGNHEYTAGVAAGYFDYWDNIPHYYSYNAGGWHFVSVDANAGFEELFPGAPQYEWIAADLTANTLPCTLVYYHQPRWNIGQQGDDEHLVALWPLLAQKGVDLVVNGHDHTYQRWKPLNGAGNPAAGGTTQFVSGAGGHALGSFVTTSSKVAASNATHFGALRLELWPGGAGWQFVTASGLVPDSGGLQCSGTPTDTTKPGVPSPVSAQNSSYTQVDLSWGEPTDGTAIAGYDVYRDGTKVASLGLVQSWADRTVVPGTIYRYRVRARDPAGNVSSESASASVTTQDAFVQFSDDFESGTMAGWTSSTGVVATTAQRFGGAYGARATAAGSPTFASKTLATPLSNLYYTLRFNVLSQGVNAVNLLKFKAAGTGKIATLSLGATGKLSYRNDVSLTTVVSPLIPTRNAWHKLEFHVVIKGSASKVEVWLDDAKVPELSIADALGAAQIAAIELGDSAAGRTSDVAFDNVSVIYSIPRDLTPPSTPTSLAATAKDGPQVDLSWTAATDNVDVTGYDIFRNGALLATAAPMATSFTDPSAVARTTYSYQVRARDYTGNLSAFSNAAAVTVGRIFGDGFATGGLELWTSATGIVAQQQEVFGGLWAARATSTGSAAFASKQFVSPQPELYTRIRFKILSQGPTSLTLLKLRNDAGLPVASVFVSSTGKLGVRNEVTATSTTSTIAVGAGWHELLLHTVNNGTTSRFDVTFDNAAVPELAKTEPLGTTPFRRVEIADSAANKTFDVAIDNVLVDAVAPGESTPPTTPLGVTVKPVTAFGVDIAWNASTDNVAVARYEIFRDGILVATVPAGTTSYLDLGVEPGTMHRYAVTAVDDADNASAASVTIWVVLPPAFFVDGFESGDASTWSKTSSLVFQQLNVHGGQWAARATSTGAGQTWTYKSFTTPQTDVFVRAWFKILSQSHTVTIIKLRDAAGGHLVSVFVGSNGALGLKNELTGVSTTSAVLTPPGGWHEVVLHVVSAGAASKTEVWLDRARIGVLARTEALGTQPVGRVELGNTTSSRTYDLVFDDAVVASRLVDTVAPSAPSGVSATAPSGFKVDLAWNASTDNIGVVAYDVLRNGSLLATLGPLDRSYADAAVAPLTAYTYEVRARDSAGNSAASAVAVTTPVGRLFADDFESGTLMTWTPVNGLFVQQQAVYAGSWAARATSSGTAAAPASGASAGTPLAGDRREVYYRVRFNVLSRGANTVNLLRFRTRTGSALVSLSINTPGALAYRNDTTGVTATSTTTIATGRWYELEVRVLVDGVASAVEVWLDGAKLADLSKTEALGSLLIGSLELGDTSTTHTFDVAFDDARADTTFIPEATPPSRPASLTATAVSETRVELAWAASTDNIGVTGYTVYRDATNLASVGAATTAYSDTTAAVGRTYVYTVTASDAAGNTSKPSDEATVTTPDAAAPTAPTALTATAASSTRVELRWNASTDNAGVVAYAIFRDGAALETSTTTSFGDLTVVKATTYRYTVVARDAAGNVSPPSNTATVTTPTPIEVLTFTPTADTYVQQDAPATNYGAAPTMVVDNSPTRRVLIKFTVSGIGARTVTSVKLRLRCVDSSPAGGTFRRVANTTWTEGGVNWSNQPPADTTALATLGTVSANTTYEVDVTALVTGDGTYTIGADSTNADGAYYATKEGAQVPQLVVTAAG